MLSSSQSQYGISLIYTETKIGKQEQCPIGRMYHENRCLAIRQLASHKERGGREGRPQREGRQRRKKRNKGRKGIKGRKRITHQGASPNNHHHCVESEREAMMTPPSMQQIT